MKKAKVILSAVALLAVVGGALAFKATREAVPLFRTTTLNGAIVCTAPTILPYFTSGTGPTVSVTSIHTTAVNGPCPGTTLFTAE